MILFFNTYNSACYTTWFVTILYMTSGTTLCKQPWKMSSRVWSPLVHVTLRLSYWFSFSDPVRPKSVEVIS